MILCFNRGSFYSASTLSRKKRERNHENARNLLLYDCCKSFQAYRWARMMLNCFELKYIATWFAHFTLIVPPPFIFLNFVQKNGKNSILFFRCKVFILLRHSIFITSKKTVNKREHKHRRTALRSLTVPLALLCGGMMINYVNLYIVSILGFWTTQKNEIRKASLKHIVLIDTKGIEKNDEESNVRGIWAGTGEERRGEEKGGGFIEPKHIMYTNFQCDKIILKHDKTI